MPFFIIWLFRRSSWAARIIVMALVFIVAILNTVRVLKAVRSINERNTHVTTCHHHKHHVS